MQASSARCVLDSARRRKDLRGQDVGNKSARDQSIV
jgi:hypothetical protein